MTNKWIASMFHINLSEYDYIEDTLKEYDIGAYFIGFEEEPYHHYHILFEGTDKIYNAFSKRIVEKYILRGKASVGACRQYGKLKSIKDIERLKAYTVKDGCVRTNVSQKILDEYIEISFKKESLQNTIDKIVESLDQTFDLHFKTYGGTYDFTPSSILKGVTYRIIAYLLETGKKFSGSSIRNFVAYYIQFSKKITNSKKNEIFQYLYTN